MHGRVTFTRASDVNKTIDAVKEHVIPALEKTEGFRGGYWLTDQAKGRGMGVVFFESEMQLEDSRDAAKMLRDKVVTQQGNTIDEVGEFEVIVTTGEKIHHDAQAARLVRVTGDPSRLAEATEQMRGAIPMLQQVDGFAGAIWLADRKAGKGVTLILFTDAEKLAQAGPGMDEMREKALKEMGATTDEVIDLDVVARAEVGVGAH